MPLLSRNSRLIARSAMQNAAGKFLGALIALRTQ